MSANRSPQNGASIPVEFYLIEWFDLRRTGGLADWLFSSLADTLASIRFVQSRVQI